MTQNSTQNVVTTDPTITVSLADLDLTQQCEKGFEFNYLSAGTGKPSTIFFTVLGSQSSTVQNWVRNNLNQRRAQEALQIKRGKELERTVEDDEEFSNEAAAVRLIGWRGIKEPFSSALALHLCTVNAEVRGQVFKASNDLANFTKG